MAKILIKNFDQKQSFDLKLHVPTVVGCANNKYECECKCKAMNNWNGKSTLEARFEARSEAPFEEWSEAPLEAQLEVQLKAQKEGVREAMWARRCERGDTQYTVYKAQLFLLAIRCVERDDDTQGVPGSGVCCCCCRNTKHDRKILRYLDLVTWWRKNLSARANQQTVNCFVFVVEIWSTNQWSVSQYFWNKSFLGWSQIFLGRDLP